MSQSDRRKVLIDVEIQMRSTETVRTMKKDLDKMDTKYNTFIAAGIGAGVGVGVGNAKGNRYLASQGIFKTGAVGPGFEQSLQNAVNESIAETFTDDMKPGGKFDLGKMLGITGFNKQSAQSVIDLVTNPKGMAMKLARVLPYAAIVLIAVQVLRILYAKVTARNGLFDLTFRRWIREEEIKTRSRELRQQVRVGERQAIFVSEAGVTHPISIVNTLELVKNKDIFDLDAFRVRKGYQF